MAAAVPLVMGFLHRGDAYVEYLKSISAYEERLYNSYAGGLGSRYSHVAMARSLADYVITEQTAIEQRGLIIRKNDPQGQSTNKLVNKMGNELAKITDDNFLLTQREILIIWIARMSVVLSCSIAMAPLLWFAFFLGEGRARILQEEGNMPMPERSDWAKTTLFFFPPLVTSLPIIPWYLNSLIIVPVLMALVILLLYVFRANFVEF